MIPHRRRFSDISDDPVISHRKRQKLDKNAHFDQMIESMSAVNSDRRQRKESSDTYKSASELSFIKKTHKPSLLRSSSASKLSSESSYSHQTYNSLPQWLVNTFMTLSKKNPLRLLLPPDAQPSPDGNDALQPETAVQPIDPLFAFNLTEPITQRSEYLMALQQATLITDDNHWSEPLPFSTPGPGSLLSSSVISNTAFSLPIPKKYLSPVSCANEIHIGFDLPSNRSHTPVYSSDSLLSDPSISSDSCSKKFATDELGSSWVPLIPEEDCQSLFLNIYSTPGPRHCMPRPAHLDSHLEDSMSSDMQPGYETIDHDAIDFHWKPFDRKNLVVPDYFQIPTYISGPAHPNAPDASKYEPTYTANLVDTYTKTLKSHTSPEPVSHLLPTSPTPFRFLLPPESNPTPVPEFQAQNIGRKPSTPKRPAYFAVPGIYISPLDGHGKAHVSNAV